MTLTVSELLVMGVGPAFTALTATDFAEFDEFLVQALTTPQINAMSSDQMNGLGDKVQFFSVEQAVAFNSSNLAKIDIDDFSSLTSDFLNNIPVAAIPTIHANQLKNIHSSAISHLTSDFLANLVPTQIAEITAIQIPNLTLAPFSDLSHFSTSAISSLSGYQVSILTKAQIRTFTASQIAALNAGASASLTLSYFEAIGYETIESPVLNSLDVIRSLTPDQLGAIGDNIKWLYKANLEQYDSLTSTQYDSLTSEQAKALFDKTDQNWINIDPNQLSEFTAEDLQSITMFNTTPSLYSAMTPLQLSGFTNNASLYITGDIIAVLSPSQFAVLNLAHLDPPVAPSITIPQLKVLNSAKAATLTSEMLSQFSSTQLSALTIKNTLTPAQLNGLSVEQKQVVKKVDMELDYIEDRKFFVKWNEDANVHPTKKMKIFVTKSVKEVTSVEKCYTVSYSDGEYDIYNLVSGNSYIIYALYYDVQDNLNTTNVLTISESSWPAERPVIICTRESTRSFHVIIENKPPTINRVLITYNTGFEAFGQSFVGAPTFEERDGKLSYVVEDDRIQEQTVEVAMVIYTDVDIGNGTTSQQVTVSSELSDTILVSLDNRPNPVTSLTSMYAKDTYGVVYMNVQWTPDRLFNDQEIGGYVLIAHNHTKQEKREILLSDVTSYSYYKNAADDDGDRIQFSITAFYYSVDNDALRNDSDEVFSNELKLVGFSPTAPSKISDSLRGDKLVRPSGSSDWYSMTLTSTSNDLIFDAYVKVENNLITAIYDKNNGNANVLIPHNDPNEFPYYHTHVYPLLSDTLGPTFQSDSLKTYFNHTSSFFVIKNFAELAFELPNGYSAYNLKTPPVFTAINDPFNPNKVTFTIEPSPSVGRNASEVMYVARVYNSSNNHSSPVDIYYLYRDDTTYTTSISGVELVNSYSFDCSFTASFDSVYVDVTEMVANIDGTVITSVLEADVSSNSYAFFAPSLNKLLYTSTVSNTGTKMVTGGLEVSFNGTTTNTLGVDLDTVDYHQEIYLDEVKIHEYDLTEDFVNIYPSDLLNKNKTSTVVTYASIPFPVEETHPSLMSVRPSIPFERSEITSIDLVNVTPQELSFTSSGVSQEINVTWDVLENINLTNLSQTITATLDGVNHPITNTNIVIANNKCSTTVTGLTDDLVHVLTVTNKYTHYKNAPFTEDVNVQSYDKEDTYIERDTLLVSQKDTRSSLSFAFLLNNSTGFSPVGFKTMVDSTPITEVDNTSGVLELETSLVSTLTSLKTEITKLTNGITSVHPLTFSDEYNFAQNKTAIAGYIDFLNEYSLPDSANKRVLKHEFDRLKQFLINASDAINLLANATPTELATIPPMTESALLNQMIDKFLETRNYWVRIENLPSTFTKVNILPYGDDLTGQRIIGTDIDIITDKVNPVVSNLEYDSSAGTSGRVELSWDSGIQETNTKFIQHLVCKRPNSLPFRLTHTVPAYSSITGKWTSTVTQLEDGINFYVAVIASYNGYSNYDTTSARVQSYDRTTINISDHIVAQVTNRIRSNFNFDLNSPTSGFTLDRYTIVAKDDNNVTSVPTVTNAAIVPITSLESTMDSLKTAAGLLKAALPPVNGPYVLAGLATLNNTMKNLIATVKTSTITDRAAMDGLRGNIAFVGEEITLSVGALIGSNSSNEYLRSFAVETANRQLLELDLLIVKFLLPRDTSLIVDFPSAYSSVTITIKGKDSNYHDIEGTDEVITNLVGNLQSVRNANYDNTEGIHNKLIGLWESDQTSVTSTNAISITARDLITKMPIPLTFTTPTYSTVSPLRFSSTITGFTKNTNYNMTIINSSSVYTNFAVGYTNAQSYDKSTFTIDNMITSIYKDINHLMSHAYNVNFESAGVNFDNQIKVAVVNRGTAKTPMTQISLSTLRLPDGLSTAMATLKTNTELLQSNLPTSSNGVTTSNYSTAVSALETSLSAMTFTITTDPLLQLYNEIIFMSNKIVTAATAIQTESSSHTLSVLTTDITSVLALMATFNLTRIAKTTYVSQFTFIDTYMIPVARDLNDHIIEGMEIMIQVDKVDITVSDLRYTTNGTSQTAVLSWKTPAQIEPTFAGFNNFSQRLTATLQDGTTHSLTNTPYSCVTGTTHNTWSTTVSNAPNGNNIHYKIQSSYNGLTNFSYDDEKGQAYNQSSFVISNMVKTPLDGSYMLRCNARVPKNMTLSGFGLTNENNYINPAHTITFTPVYSMNTADADRAVSITITGLTNDERYKFRLTPIATDQNEISRNGTVFSDLLHCYPRIVPSKPLVVTTDLFDNSVIRVNISNSLTPNTSNGIKTKYEIYRKKNAETDTAFTLVHTKAYTNSMTSYSWFDETLDNTDDGNTYVYKVTASLADDNNSLDDSVPSTTLLYNDSSTNNTFTTTALSQDLYDAPRLTLNNVNGKINLTMDMRGSPLLGLMLFTANTPEAVNGSPLEGSAVDYYDRNSLNDGGSLYLRRKSVTASGSGDDMKGTSTFEFGDFRTGTNVLAIAWNDGGAATATLGGPVLPIETFNGGKLTTYNNIQSIN